MRSRPQVKRILCGNAGVLAVGMALAIGAAPTAAKAKFKHRYVRNRLERVIKEPFGDIPKGPLQIFISIAQQRLHFYSDGVHVADAPVATGVPGHLTPRGVYSIIQRDRYHHSNIYSNAPMPYMQRITWSGVALHEGPGVGHEASHGCIRMPHDFAARLWLLHTIGARVIIAQPELRPIPFADAHLFVHKDIRSAPVAAISKAVETGQAIAPTTRTDVGESLALHGPPGITDKSEQTIEAASTATAAAFPFPSPSPTATAGGPTEPPQADPAQAATATASQSAPLQSVANEPPNPTITPGATPAKPAATAQAAPPQGKATATAPTDFNEPLDAAAQDMPLPPLKPARLAEHGPAAPISIFISRKTRKLYVRQNFTPLFEVPVTIDNPTEPLGTHVFTAMDYLADDSTLRWNVVSLPSEPAKVVRKWKWEWRYVRDFWGRRWREAVRVPIVRVQPAQPSETPQEALARIEIPQDVIDQISQLIAPGSSLILSDHGLGPETGSGTDFIVITR